MFEFLFFFLAGVVISSFSDESINGADLGFTTPDQYGPISVPVAGDMSSTVQVSTNVFDSSAANPSNVQGQNFLLNGQFDPSSGQAHGDGNTALLFDESTGGGGEGTEILIPSVPTQILEGVPDTTDESLSNLKKPECKVNKYLFCCQKAAPKLKGGKITTGRAPAVEPKVHPDFIEYAQRRRKCHSCRLNPPPLILSVLFSCLSNLIQAVKGRRLQISLLGGGIGSADDPACHWPENIFCCYCKDNVCYQNTISFSTTNFHIKNKLSIRDSSSKLAKKKK